MTSLKKTRLGIRRVVLGFVLLTSTSTPWADEPAHRFEIMPFGGYRLGGTVGLSDTTYSRLDFGDGGVYGVSVGMRMAPLDEAGDGLVEFMWTHQDSSLKALGNPGQASQSVDMSVDQFHLNGLYFPTGFERVLPYAIAGVGATRFAPTDAESSLTRFSWALGGGLKIPMTRRLGARLEAKWDPALAQSSGGIFCNSATGQCYTAASGDLINQFDFTAGLSLAF